MISRSLTLLALALLPFGCSSSSTPAKHTGPDGAPPTGTGGAGGGSAYDSGTSGEVTCGGVKCTLPTGGGIEQIKTCCTDSGGCGLKLPTLDKCLPRDLPGKSEPTCPTPTYKTIGGDSLSACCGPNGCGALDPFLGCVPNPELGAPAASCVYDPTNDCTALTGITCDGPEDCPQGKHCCGKLVGGAAYTQFGCFDSCDALVDGGSPFRWLELCHAGDVCENPSFTCLASTILPKPFARCDSMLGGAPDPTSDKSAGHVACGTGECGTGEKCCVRAPHAPYCAKADEPCKCHPAGLDGGSSLVSTDSGVAPNDAGDASK